MLYEDAGELGNAEMAGDLVRIVSSGKHLLTLINDVLDLSKIEAGKMQLHLKDVSLPQLVSEVMDNVEPLIISNGNKITVNCEEKIGSIHSDAAKLKQVLINVLGNAAKFTHDGEVSLSVERAFDKGIEWAVFRIVDTGIGISKDQQKNLFKAFTQADESTTRQYGGTGLGLTISRSMCELMGGNISVNSQLQGGSEFLIHVPARVLKVGVENSVVNIGHRTSVPASARGTKLTSAENVDDRREKMPVILVIDNDPSVSDLLQRALGADGFHVETVSSGREGLQRAADIIPDLIILDVIMSDMSGWPVLSQLKKNPELMHVPVIMHSMTEERATAAALGAADYVTKPADRDELVDAIKTNLRANVIPTVLVVDEDVDARRLTRMVFENEGWNVVEGIDAEIGLMRVAEQMPSVIVLDAMLSKMKAIEFVQALTKSAEWKTIPVLVLTGQSMSEQEREQLLEYVDMVIEKGAYSLDTLLRRLRELIGDFHSDTVEG